MRGSKCQSTDLVPLYIGVKNCSDHAHKTDFWYLLEFPMIDYPPSFLYGSAPPPPRKTAKTGAVNDFRPRTSRLTTNVNAIAAFYVSARKGVNWLKLSYLVLVGMKQY